MRFEELDVWKISARLAADILMETEKMKHFGFRDQITRSAISIPSNISEGAERISPRELIQFLAYAKGSCGELRTQIYIGMKANMLNRDRAKEHINTTKQVSVMLHHLILSIKKKNHLT